MRKLNYARFILLLVLTLGLNACGGDDVYYTDGNYSGIFS